MTVIIECELNRDAFAVVTTIAGRDNYGMSDGTGTHVRFRKPIGVILDASGNAFVSDYFNQRIRKVTPDGGARVIVVWIFVISWQNDVSVSRTCEVLAYVSSEVW